MSTRKFAPAFATGSSVCARVPTWFSISFRQREMCFTVTGMAVPPLSVSWRTDAEIVRPLPALPKGRSILTSFRGCLLSYGRNADRFGLFFRFSPGSAYALFMGEWNVQVGFNTPRIIVLVSAFGKLKALLWRGDPWTFAHERSIPTHTKEDFP